jgi:hypothetical protein
LKEIQREKASESLKTLQPKRLQPEKATGSGLLGI